jgi:transposase
MARPQREPLRPLTPQEAATLQRIAKATSERHDRRQRASALLAVAAGAPFCDAARQAGYREADSISKVVARFNQHGLAALDIARGRGHPATYGPTQRARILAMLQRPPQRRADGTATWSLVVWERALRQEGAGLERLSATTIRAVLHAAGYTFQRTRTWCPTGTARRKRKAGVVTVVDPEAERKRG